MWASTLVSATWGRKSTRVGHTTQYDRTYLHNLSKWRATSSNRRLIYWQLRWAGTCRWHFAYVNGELGCREDNQSQTTTHSASYYRLLDGSPGGNIALWTQGRRRSTGRRTRTTCTAWRRRSTDDCSVPHNCSAKLSRDKLETQFFCLPQTENSKLCTHDSGGPYGVCSGCKSCSGGFEEVWNPDISNTMAGLGSLRNTAPVKVGRILINQNWYNCNSM